MPSEEEPAGSAPGRPGRDAYWTNGNKDGMGTSVDRGSKVWFTLGEGRLTEVYYPTVDQANTRDLRFVVSDGSTFTVLDTQAGTTRVEVADDRAMAFRYVTEDPEHGFQLKRTYITDPHRNSVMIDVELESSSGKPLDLYVVHDPSLKNSGRHDQGYLMDQAMVAQEGDVASALASSQGFQETNIGYLGTSDGLAGLLSSHHLGDHYTRARDGNVIEVGKLASGAPHSHVTLAMGFGTDGTSAAAEAAASLRDGFPKAYQEYVKGWHDYLGSLRPVATPHRQQYDMSCMLLKAHEDKTYTGAMIASLTVPWGHSRPANEGGDGGYHLVWVRDLYQNATAALAMGDRALAERALDYIFHVQQRPDGSVPQNSWLNGTPYWPGLQMDQVAFPIVLAHQLGHTDVETYRHHIQPAADFIAQRGPFSPQERWEEQDGLSPSTVAAEIAGLISAADIAEKNGDSASAGRWRSLADSWVANLEKWLVTTNGPHEDGQYYLRINDNLDPNDGHRRDLKNGAGVYDEREIVDAGFLELVRLGIKSASDPLIQKSLAVVDQVIRRETPSGPGFYRYNHDGYGEHSDGSAFGWGGTGRLWPLFNGERAEYAIAAGDREEAEKHIDTMARMANAGRMIPEQVWDRPTNPPGMNLGRACDVLKDHMGLLDTAAGEGRPDGLFTQKDVQAVAGREGAPVRLREACQFLLGHPEHFAEMDTAFPGAGTPDGKVGRWDLDATLVRHREDLAPSSLVFGEGTGSATPLAWSNAGFVRAVVNLAEGRNTETPEPLLARYQSPA